MKTINANTHHTTIDSEKIILTLAWNEWRRARVRNFLMHEIGISRFQAIEKNLEVDVQLDWSYISTSTTLQQTPKPTETDRKKRRKTTGDEKAILSQLSEYKKKLPETAVREVLSKLSPDWTSERVKLYWSNNLRGKSNWEKRLVIVDSK